MRLNYLVIEGNIGAGKTSLAEMIAKDFGARVLLEQFKDNPFLPKFYEDQRRYAFPLEMSFLADRYNQLKKYLGEPELFSSFLVADYHFSKSLIFARNTLAEDEFILYRRFFDLIYDRLPRPDLYVYLHVNPEKLILNIRKRNRAYEQNIQLEYLEKISKGYFSFLKHVSEFPVLLIDTTKLDFIENKKHYQMLTHYLFDQHYSPGINRIQLD